MASYFVPIANLFVPPGIVRELWNRSHGEDEWQAKADVAGVSIWWAGYLGGGLILTLLGILALYDGMTNAIVLVPPRRERGYARPRHAAAVWFGIKPRAGDRRHHQGPK
ncbi:DUF4328 domain-containing protein [Novosphingobium colocasiae]